MDHRVLGSGYRRMNIAKRGYRESLPQGWL
jgi:hypothetical protein